MITTNVDRAIQLLDEKGQVDVKEMAKTLGANQDSIDLVLSYLEEEGLVELKYGVFHTIASLKKEKKKEEEQGPVKKIEEEIGEGEEAEEAGKKEPEEHELKLEEKKPELKPKQLEKLKPGVEGEEKPVLKKPELKPAEKPKTEEAPKPAEKGIIPRFDETQGSKIEQRSAKLANMMIKLLEKTQRMTPEEKPKAEAVLKDILSLAKQNKIYSHRTPSSSEFTLGSMLLTARLLLDEYREDRKIETAKKIYSTYSLLKKSALGTGKSRLKYYENQISGVHSIIVKNIYPVLQEHEKKEREERLRQEKAELERKKKEEDARAQAELEKRRRKEEYAKSAELNEKKKELERKKTELAKKISEERKKQIQQKQFKPARLKPSKPEPAGIQEHSPARAPIPRFNASEGTTDEQNAAKIANTMISLLEKYYNLPKESRQNAILVLNDVMKLAKQNKVYSHKTPVTAEFILCSLIVGAEALIAEHGDNLDVKISKRINSTYHLVREVAMEIDKARLKYYIGFIDGIYKKAMAATFSAPAGK